MVDDGEKDDDEFNQRIATLLRQFQDIDDSKQKRTVIYKDNDGNRCEFIIKDYHITDFGIIEICNLFNHHQIANCPYFNSNEIFKSHSFFRNTTIYDKTHFFTSNEAIQTLVLGIHNHTNRYWQKAAKYIVAKGAIQYFKSICKYEQEKCDEIEKEKYYKDCEDKFNWLVRRQEQREELLWKDYYCE